MMLLLHRQVIAFPLLPLTLAVRVVAKMLWVFRHEVVHGPVEKAVHLDADGYCSASAAQGSEGLDEPAPEDSGIGQAGGKRGQRQRLQ